MKLPTFILELVENQKSISQLLILTSFTFTFLLVRLITHLQKAQILGTQTGNVHIHHLVPGIFLLLASGFAGISFWNFNRIRHASAILFGIGAALTIDEFALWLFLRDVYWAQQGRDSIDAIIVAVMVLTISLILSQVRMMKFLKKITKSKS